MMKNFDLNRSDAFTGGGDGHKVRAIVLLWLQNSNSLGITFSRER